MGYRLVEHTADMGIDAWGETPEQVFVDSAKGLKEIVAGRQDCQAQEEVLLSAEADDRAGLLVAFLNEVLHIIENRRLLPAEFEVLALTDSKIEAKVRGEYLDRGRKRLEREVKAVTYHQLRCEQTGEGSWEVRFFVDL